MSSLEETIQLLRGNSNPENGLAMASYMKNQFTFLGIKKPDRMVLEKDFLTTARKSGKLDWEGIDHLWKLPEREFQYLALDILAGSKKLLSFSDLPVLKKLIVTKSWWDTVDWIASHFIGEIIDVRNGDHRNKMVEWSREGNIWLARSAILFQLKYKEKTDKELLEIILKNNLGSKEFFINKAIGWILRENSKRDKDWVIGFIENNALHPLSKREGSKYI